MRFEIFNKIEELEQLMFKGYNLWIFRGYVAIDKRGAEKIIDEIYATLPEDIKKAREFLKNNNQTVESHKSSGMYDTLKFLEELLDKNTFFSSYTLVDKKELEQIKEQLKEAVPEEIYKAERIDR